MPLMLPLATWLEEGFRMSSLIVTPLATFPWCFVGDFKSILGIHKHKGCNNPNKTHMQDFKAWSDQTKLVDIPTKLVNFTWYNGRSGRALVERNLDRAFCNQNWVSTSHIMTISTLLKLRSDHHPILLESSFSYQMLVSQFKFLSMWTLHDNCKDFVDNIWYTQVIGCPMFVLTVTPQFAIPFFPSLSGSWSLVHLHAHVIVI